MVQIQVLIGAVLIESLVVLPRIVAERQDGPQVFRLHETQTTHGRETHAAVFDRALEHRLRANPRAGRGIIIQATVDYLRRKILGMRGHPEPEVVIAFVVAIEGPSHGQSGELEEIGAIATRRKVRRGKRFEAVSDIERDGLAQDRGGLQFDPAEPQLLRPPQRMQEQATAFALTSSRTSEVHLTQFAGRSGHPGQADRTHDFAGLVNQDIKRTARLQIHAVQIGQIAVRTFRISVQTVIREYGVNQRLDGVTIDGYGASERKGHPLSDHFAGPQWDVNGCRMKSGLPTTSLAGTSPQPRESKLLEELSPMA